MIYLALLRQMFSIYAYYYFCTKINFCYHFEDKENRSANIRKLQTIRILNANFFSRRTDWNL